ncbi:MAG: indole-3-glycerol phosphate synthase TrpC [Pseudomonadota bacterium]
MPDTYQVWEARAWGADCILLIVAALRDDELHSLSACAEDLGLDILIEIHDEEELARALRLPTGMIGVNNRNLKTLEVNLETGLRLAEQIPPDRLFVAESGISHCDHIRVFQEAGANAFLVGESLMRQHDVGAATRALRGVAHS